MEKWLNLEVYYYTFKKHVLSLRKSLKKTLYVIELFFKNY